MTFCCEARGDCVQYFCEGEVLGQHRGPCRKGGSQAPLGAQDEGGSGLREREELRRLALLHDQAVKAPSGGRGRQGGCWTRGEGEPTPQTWRLSYKWCKAKQGHTWRRRRSPPCPVRQSL